MKKVAGLARNLGFAEVDGGLVPSVEVVLVFAETEWGVDMHGLSKTTRSSECRFKGHPDALREVASKLNEFADDAEALAKTHGVKLEK